MNFLSRPSDCLDSDLVLKSREGDRDAFGLLVSRHQAAASAVAYSVCGDFATSEDIAQEGFVTAWKQLTQLREPERFRAWLCGIVRQLALNHVRQRERRGGRALENLGTEPAPLHESPRETAVSSEEKVLLWRTLDRLPPIYREALVLFYREQKSIQATAEALDLTEDAVKQRLNRGRVLLRNEISQVLEGVLGATRPEVTFTLSVIATLPPVASAVGLAVATGTAKATTSGSGASLLSGSTLALVAGSLVSGLVGLLGIYVTYRLWRSPWISPQARRAMKGLSIASFATTLALLAVIFWIESSGSQTLLRWGLRPGGALAAAIVVVVVTNFIFSAGVGIQLYRSRRSWAGEQSGRPPLRWSKRFTTRARFLGLPLVSVALGSDSAKLEKRGVAKGWIAIGDIAYGGLFAFGGLVVAPIAMGGVGLGLFMVGGVCLSALGFGGIGLGWVVCAGVAVAWKCALGGIAVAFDVAIGGLAIASQWALGGVALAAHANDSATMTSLQTRPFFALILSLLPHAGWLSLLGLPSLLIVLRQLNRTPASSSNSPVSPTPRQAADKKSFV